MLKTFKPLWSHADHIALLIQNVVAGRISFGDGHGATRGGVTEAVNCVAFLHPQE